MSKIHSQAFCRYLSTQGLKWTPRLVLHTKRYQNQQAAPIQSQLSDFLTMQCASMITETAAAGVIQNNIQNTPNRLLQTYLDTAPSVNITPTTLDPLILFAGASFTSTEATTQTIILTNTGSSSITFNVSITPSGLIGSFVTASPSTGRPPLSSLLLLKVAALRCQTHQHVTSTGMCRLCSSIPVRVAKVATWWDFLARSVTIRLKVKVKSCFTGL